MTNSTFAPPLGSPPAVQFIAVERLAVDMAYQRTIESRASQRLIDRIATAWDWRLCVPLLVSQREGRLYIIDGQHRWAAASRRGDIPHLPCAVADFGGLGEEAALFVASNRRRVQVNRVDLFRAAVAGEDPPSLIIDQLVREAGLTIGRSVNPHNFKAGELACTAGLYSALAKHGRSIVSAALTQMGEDFPGQVMTYGAVIFGALIKLFASPPPDFDSDILSIILKEMTADEWAEHPDVEEERGGGQRIDALRRVIIAAMAEHRALAA